MKEQEQRKEQEWMIMEEKGEAEVRGGAEKKEEQRKPEEQGKVEGWRKTSDILYLSQFFSVSLLMEPFVFIKPSQLEDLEVHHGKGMQVKIDCHFC